MSSAWRVELTLHVGQSGNGGVVGKSWNHATTSLESIARARKGAEIWVDGGADVLELDGAVAVRSVGAGLAVAGARNGTVLVGHDWGAGDVDPAEKAGWRVGAAKEVPVADGGWSSWDERNDGTVWHDGGARGDSGSVGEGGCRSGDHAGGAHGRVPRHAAGRWSWRWSRTLSLNHHEVDEFAAGWHLIALCVVDRAGADLELLDASTAEIVCVDIGLAAQLGYYRRPRRGVGHVEPRN